MHEASILLGICITFHNQLADSRAQEVQVCLVGLSLGGQIQTGVLPVGSMVVERWSAIPPIPCIAALQSSSERIEHADWKFSKILEFSVRIIREGFLSDWPALSRKHADCQPCPAPQGLQSSERGLQIWKSCLACSNQSKALVCRSIQETAEMPGCRNARRSVFRKFEAPVA